MTTKNDLRKEAENSTVAWFVVLERAKDSNDFALAAKALKRLEELGVIVTYKGKLK